MISETYLDSSRLEKLNSMTLDLDFVVDETVASLVFRYLIFECCSKPVK